MIRPRLEAPSLSQLIEEAKDAERSGQWDEALVRYGAAFAALPSEGSAADAANLMRWTGTVHRERGDWELATELYEASLAVARAAAVAEAVPPVLNCLAVLAQFDARPREAESLYVEAQKAAAAQGDDWLCAAIDQNLGTLADIQGEPETAILRYHSALARVRSLRDEATAGAVLNNMGMSYVDMERWPEATRCFDEAFDVADRLRDVALLADVELNRAEMHLKRGQPDTARERCERAFEIYGRLESDPGRAEVFKLYGVLYRQTGKPFLAESAFQNALERARACGDRLLEAECENERARLQLSQQQNKEALRALNRAHRLFSELSARREVMDLERRLDGIEETYLEVVQAWGESIESKDLYTAGHCERVAGYACMLAEAVGFAGRDLTWFRMGGFLHDVGKIEVPAAVLNKPGKLTAEEWELMKSHTVVGHEIVEELNFPWDIGPLVRNHHERWDGTGYPDGLAGSEIPLGARVLCVADVYDALTTARSYRPALSHEEAIRIMERDAGTALDPELFRLFRKLIETGGEASDLTLMSNTGRPGPRRDAGARVA